MMTIRLWKTLVVKKGIKRKNEKRNNNETVMAARERFLTRKQMKLEST